MEFTVEVGWFIYHSTAQNIKKRENNEERCLQASVKRKGDGKTKQHLTHKSEITKHNLPYTQKSMHAQVTVLET